MSALLKGILMDVGILDNKFARIGARLKLADRLNRRIARDGLVRLDVRNDKRGEYFEIACQPGASVEVDAVDVQPADRHLLLMVRENGEKHKFLCGHDERHWFVAAIPESASGVATVRTAKEALKPREVQIVQATKQLKAKARNRRKNAAYIRQGEWFFIPAPSLQVDPKLILCNEPITRGNGGKPHWAEECFRRGGQVVYVCSRHPGGVSQVVYLLTLKQNRAAKNWGWRMMLRNPEVYVRGRIRHSDHSTIQLHGWHRVLMNTETQAKAMERVAFLD